MPQLRPFIAHAFSILHANESAAEPLQQLDLIAATDFDYALWTTGLRYVRCALSACACAHVCGACVFSACSGAFAFVVYVFCVCVNAFVRVRL